MSQKLPLDFYQRDTLRVAEELLGKKLVHKVNSKIILSGLITETEAYLGIEDPACHTFRNRRSPRTESMFLPGGHAYIYFIYGLHFCFNVVTTLRSPEAVLIRGLLPLEGIPMMMCSRKTTHTENLTNGPGKLCQALQITKALDGLILNSESLFISEYPITLTPDQVQVDTRVGIDFAGDAAHWPLRFRIDPSLLL